MFAFSHSPSRREQGTGIPVHYRSDFSRTELSDTFSDEFKSLLKIKKKATMFLVRGSQSVTKRVHLQEIILVLVCNARAIWCYSGLFAAQESPY